MKPRRPLEPDDWEGGGGGGKRFPAISDVLSVKDNEYEAKMTSQKEAAKSLLGQKAVVSWIAGVAAKAKSQEELRQSEPITHMSSEDVEDESRSQRTLSLFSNCQDDGTGCRERQGDRLLPVNSDSDRDSFSEVHIDFPRYEAIREDRSSPFYPRLLLYLWAFLLIGPLGLLIVASLIKIKETRKGKQGTEDHFASANVIAFSKINPSSIRSSGEHFLSKARPPYRDTPDAISIHEDVVRSSALADGNANDSGQRSDQRGKVIDKAFMRESNRSTLAILTRRQDVQLNISGTLERRDRDGCDTFRDDVRDVTGRSALIIPEGKELDFQEDNDSSCQVEYWNKTPVESSISTEPSFEV